MRPDLRSSKVVAAAVAAFVFGLIAGAAVDASEPGTPELIARWMRGSHRAPEWRKEMQRELQKKRSKNPQYYDRIVVTELSIPERAAMSEPGTAGLVLTFRNVHNWMNGKPRWEIALHRNRDGASDWLWSRATRREADHATFREHQHPRFAVRNCRRLASSLSAQVHWLRGPDLNRRPSGEEVKKTGFRDRSQPIGIS